MMMVLMDLMTGGIIVKLTMMAWTAQRISVQTTSVRVQIMKIQLVMIIM